MRFQYNRVDGPAHITCLVSNMGDKSLQPFIDYLNSGECELYEQQPMDSLSVGIEATTQIAKIDTGESSYLVHLSDSPSRNLEAYLTLLPRVKAETDTHGQYDKRQRSRDSTSSVDEELRNGTHVCGSDSRETSKRKTRDEGEVMQTNEGEPSVVGKVPKDSLRAGRNPVPKLNRERLQRIHRDAFRKKVLSLANTWIRWCKNGDALKLDIVINEDSCKPKSQTNKRSGKQRKKTTALETYCHEEKRSDILFSKQNGYFYYHILCTKEVEALVARNRTRRESEGDMDVYVDKLATIADIYLRVMFNNDIRPAVFIKFDDNNIPALFARQTQRSMDTCMTGPPALYWTKILNLDNLVKTSQHITLQRVRSSRLIQDSTFVVVGEGGMLEQMYSITPERFVSPSQYRRCFKEMYEYIASIPENDLSRLGWEVINEAGVLDPIKTFLSKVIDSQKRPADDVAFLNFMDMFVTMVVHRHKVETSSISCQTSIQVKVYRTEYKYELAGLVDHPGVYYYRNPNDYITDLSMVNMRDNLLDEDEISARLLSGDGVYFYDVQPVNDVLLKLRTRGITAVTPNQDDFYKYVLSECDDVQEMIAVSNHTINRRLQDVLKEELYARLHDTDPARLDPKRCFEHSKTIEIKCNLNEYVSTYYIEKASCLTRVFAKPPTGLNSSDCLLRSFRLKWKGPGQNGKTAFVMYPVFCVVFKNLSLFHEVILEDLEALPDEDFAFPLGDGNLLCDANPKTETVTQPVGNNDGSLTETEIRMPTYDTGLEELLAGHQGSFYNHGHAEESTSSILAAGFAIPEFDYTDPLPGDEERTKESDNPANFIENHRAEEESQSDRSALSSFTPPLPPQES